MEPSSDPTSAWKLLVRYSIEAWKPLPLNALLKGILEKCNSLDEFLEGQTLGFAFWFFQKREAFLRQDAMTKWSRDRLDDYILLPAANGYVSRATCFFVSHFWHSKNDPDPEGKYLRLHQESLGPQSWDYIWVDWTCTPQSPRTPAEETYFASTLQTMSAIIRNAGFTWFYPPFEPRLWILYEIAEYALTCDLGIDPYPDIKEYLEHVKEMLKNGVRTTLEKHGYRSTYESDKEFLVSWLELLMLTKKLRLDTADIRQLFDNLTWHRLAGIVICNTTRGTLQLYRFEGVLELNGERHTFKPFPNWVFGNGKLILEPKPSRDKNLSIINLQ
ncbi:unnamed protein product [Clonostachys rosea]|uniref:Heterokaryon incompatibility domain-containing protein n=1 Tax=Bionectria ochroleuca TaxID=29856 RepID=A0ABY6UVC0_BIOOC|nr:unnamed protein product [Clonostachys rosea]